MLGLTVTNRSRRAPVPKEGIEKDWKATMLRAGKSDKILVAAFTNGLRKGKFLFSLYKNDQKTMLDVLYRATKYMNVEDALLAWEEKPKKRERQEDAW